MRQIQHLDLFHISSCLPQPQVVQEKAGGGVCARLSTMETLPLTFFRDGFSSSEPQKETNMGVGQNRLTLCQTTENEQISPWFGGEVGRPGGWECTTTS